MPAIIVREAKPIDLPSLIRELKVAGYRKGSWETIPGTDVLRIKAWRILSGHVKNLEIPVKSPSRSLRK